MAKHLTIEERIKMEALLDANISVDGTLNSQMQH